MSRAAKGSARLSYLNAAGAGEAERQLLDCCGSRAWARAVAAGRPFASSDNLHAAAQRAFDELVAADWEEAFAAHPRIGERASSGHQSERGERWSGLEQSSLQKAENALREALAAGNRRYEARFGRRYVVRASGRGAAELLALLEHRLTLDSASELRSAAAEQREITELRIDKMLEG